MRLERLNLKDGTLLKLKEDVNLSNIPVREMKNKIYWYTLDKDEIVLYLCCHNIEETNLYGGPNFFIVTLKLLVNDEFRYHEFEVKNLNDFSKLFNACYEEVSAK